MASGPAPLQGLGVRWRLCLAGQDFESPWREGDVRVTGPLYHLVLLLAGGVMEPCRFREKVTAGIEPSRLSHVHREAEQVGPRMG